MYTFVVRDEGSSVYRALAKSLAADAYWKRLKKDSTKANLIFLERNNQPFWKIGQQPGLRQLVNYYRGSDIITRKTKLVSVLAHHCLIKNKKAFEWLPESFIIRPIQNLERYADKINKPRALKNMTDERGEFLSAFENSKTCGQGEVWIAKSSSGAKGEGIIISKSPEELITKIETQKEAHIVQKYIETPLLLPGHRKFDIRCWVILDHEYRIHLMKEGVLRTCSEPYNESDLSHVTSHLTNHCIQEELSEHFGKYEDSNEMFYAEFNKYLQETHQTTMEDTILPQIRVVIKQCLLAIKEDIETEGLPYQSFQLFGFDFMVDAQFKVWLIEVNGAPACAQRLLPLLISGLHRIVISSVFPPHMPDDITDDSMQREENHFELL